MRVAVRKDGSALYACRMLANVHRASFLTSYSSQASRWMIAGMSGVAISASICVGVPAATFESAQQASFLVRVRSAVTNGEMIRRKPPSRTACVDASDPVSMFERARSAGTCTVLDPNSKWYSMRGIHPAATMASMKLLFPSAIYASAHAVSARRSPSSRCKSFSRVGSAGITNSLAGAGLPRTRFESAHVALRSGVIWPAMAVASIISRTRGMAPLRSKIFRYSAQSPAILDRHHTACSRASSDGEERRPSRGTMAPASMTALQWFVVPDATLVRHHAASKVIICIVF
eukprot:scaffold310573_cov32-Tisochrysis_lutea.AAC.2